MKRNLNRLPSKSFGKPGGEEFVYDLTPIMVGQERYDTYPAAEAVIKSGELKAGNYQIQKIFVVEVEEKIIVEESGPVRDDMTDVPVPENLKFGTTVKTGTIPGDVSVIDADDVEEMVEEFEYSKGRALRVHGEDNVLTDQDWEMAKIHLDESIEAYESIPTGAIALNVFIRPLAARFDIGERSEDLYDAIMGIS